MGDKLIRVSWQVAVLALCVASIATAQILEPPPPQPPVEETPETPPEPAAAEEVQQRVLRLEDFLALLRPENIRIQPPLPTATEVVFTGNTVISSEELREIAGIKPGQVITEDVLRAAVENILKGYQERGYVGGVVEAELPAPGEAGPLLLAIDELRIGAVRFEGLHKTRASEIRRMLELKPGEVFSRRKLTRDYIRLQQLGLYEDIAFAFEYMGPGEAALIWRLKEREKFNYISVGGSYSPSDRLVGTAELIFGNLRGRGERLRVIGSIGSVDAQVGGEAEYYNPWIAPRDTSLFASLFSTFLYRFSRDLVTQPIRERYFERHTGFRGLISSRVRANLLLAPGLRLESVNLNDFPATLLSGGASQDTTLLLANVRATLDLRNSALEPTSGTYTVGFVEGGVSDLVDGAASGIGKLWAERRWYVPTRETAAANLEQPVGRVPVIAVRLMLAGSVGDLPFSEQYFVGGVSELSLRGYLDSRFWGKYAMLANAELRWPLGSSLTGVAFIDTGDAWGSDFQFPPDASISTDFRQHVGFSPSVGGGVGVRYISPYGIVRLDLAYGDRLRVYLTAGQAF